MLFEKFGVRTSSLTLGRILEGTAYKEGCFDDPTERKKLVRQMNKQRQTDKIRQQKGYPPRDPTLKKYQKTKGLTRK